MRQKHSTIAIFIVVIILVIVVLIMRQSRPNPGTDVTPPQVQKPVDPFDMPAPANYAGIFTTVKLGDDAPLAQLTDLVGESNLETVLGINRLDTDNVRGGKTVMVPDNFGARVQWAYMPHRVRSARDIPKLIVVSQQMQAFGVYESGILVHSGPVSTGKKSTPTPSGLYFANWKGEEVISTFDDEWILRWNINIDNDAGIALHQYEMVGRPASHGCVRLLESDAVWLYNWIDQWQLDQSGQTVLQTGTPVIIFGTYDFDAPAPWKQLPTNPHATDVSKSELESIVKKYHSRIMSSAS